MKKVLPIFLLCFVISSLGLYFITGEIWLTKEPTPTTNFTPLILFSLDTKYQEQLDERIISPSLREIFAENDIHLGKDAFVKIEHLQQRWIIDSGEEEFYAIEWEKLKKEEEYVLNVYKDQENMIFIDGKQKIRLNRENKLLEGQYFHYDKNNRKDFVLDFDEMFPKNSKRLLLKKPVCHYFPEKKEKKEKKSSSSNTTQMDDVDYYRITADDGEVEKTPSIFVVVPFKEQSTFSELYLTGNVKVYGYRKRTDGEDEQVNRLNTNTLYIDLQKRTLETDDPVELEQNGFLKLNAIGMRGDMEREELHFLRDAAAEITVPGENKEDEEPFIHYVFSQSKGSLKLRQNKESEQVFLKQENNVKIISHILFPNQLKEEIPQSAHLDCDFIQLDFLKEKEKGNKLRLERFLAKGSVHFLDGKNKGECEQLEKYVLPNEQEKIILTGKPRLFVDDLAGFSILPPENVEDLKKEKTRRQLETLYGEAEEKIEWTRSVVSSRVTPETILFQEKAFLKQTSGKIKLMQLRGNQVKMLLTTHRRKDGGLKRQFVALHAKKDVDFSHDQIDATGNLLRWQQVSQNVRKIYLSGNPVVVAKQVTINSQDTITPILPSDKKKETSAKEPKESIEDIQITSDSPMYLSSQERKNSRVIRCQTRKNVRIIRYLTGTKEEIGNFQSELFKAELEENDISPKKKRDINYLYGKGNVVINSPEGSGSGDELEIRRKDGKKSMRLTGDAKINGESGSLAGDVIIFEGKEAKEGKKENRLAARGNPVIFDSKDLSGRGSRLYYLSENEQVHLTGSPAVVWQKDEQKENKNTLYAEKIDYFRERGELKASQKVHMLLDSGSGFQGAWQQGKKSEKTEEEKERYQLWCDDLFAQFDQEKQELQSFSAEGKVHLENILESPQDEVKKAFGNVLTYNGSSKKAVLYGEPGKRAVVWQDKNKVHSPQFDIYEKEERAYCHGPAKILLSNLKASSFSLTSNPKKQPDENKETLITCEGPVEFIQTRREILLKKNVIVKMDEGDLESQRLKILLDENQQIQEMIASKQVKLRSEEHTAEADQLRWYEKKRQAILTGYPHVLFRSKNTNMQIPILWYNLDEKRFFTRGGGISMERTPSER